MIFGLDYDDTFTADPDLWHAFATLAAKRGHRVIGVTARNRDQIIEDQKLLAACESVVYCAGHAKYDTVLTLLDLAVDVWIDDKPHYVSQSYASVHGGRYPMDDAHELTYVPMVVSTKNLSENVNTTRKVGDT